jgi:hypothetical protein
VDVGVTNEGTVVNVDTDRVFSRPEALGSGKGKHECQDWDRERLWSVTTTDRRSRISSIELFIEVTLEWAMGILNRHL